MRTIGLVVSLLLIPAVGHAQFHCVNPTGSGGRFSSISASADLPHFDVPMADALEHNSACVEFRV